MKALETKTSTNTKLKLRVYVTDTKPVQSCDDAVFLETVCANKLINSAFTNTKQHVWSGLVQQIDALNNNVETLEAIYANGKLIGSGCALQLVKQSAIDISETKQLRASAHIPSLGQFSNPNNVA